MSTRWHWQVENVTMVWRLSGTYRCWPGRLGGKMATCKDFRGSNKPLNSVYCIFQSNSTTKLTTWRRRLHTMEPVIPVSRLVQSVSTCRPSWTWLNLNSCTSTDVARPTVFGANMFLGKFVLKLQRTQNNKQTPDCGIKCRVEWLSDTSCDGRVVKALDLKSNGVSPRRFEPCSQRGGFTFSFRHLYALFCWLNV